ncbi:hypothetical protein V565_174490 [Rhizoctonia solani 123E]|uniref:DUF6589 domain-containing protein n=1 Tax=Rhizoctonia solani 123E TaxID=1423351 RepID=A0A074SA87_9AGAM|nr:hypothetical protein V565_174490 [Rhizoctonia solani 123E]
MAINKRKKQTKSSAETNENTSANTSSEKSDDSARPDTSNLSWPKLDTLPVIDDPALHARCIPVLETLKEQELGLGEFVWAINWGNEASRTNKLMQTARKDFRGEYLIPTLHNVRIPPRTKAKGDRAEGAKESIDAFALSLVGNQFREEMRGFERHYEGLKPETLTEDNFMDSIGFNRIQSLVYTWCPTLFMMLYMLSTCYYRRERWESNGSNADFFITMIICCMAYQLSSYNNAMQRLLGYYFHAKHVPKAVIGLLAKMNLSMSYSSITSTLANLSKSILQAMREAVAKFPVIFVHDNIRIKQAVRSQRHNNQTVTDNGTAMTVIIMPESARPAWEDPEAVRALRNHIEAQRALGRPLRVTFSDLQHPNRQARVLTHKLFHLFDILCAIPGFKDIKILSSSLLQRPSGFHELKEFITRQFMLGTRPFDESSYVGSIMVIQDFLRQVGLDYGDPLVRLTLERIIPWIGDELTVRRLEMLQWQRQEESNGYDRLDPFIFIFGWFHTLMCLASSMFENHRGTKAGVGFAHSVLVLGRIGFSMNMRQQRPDYHTVKEFLMHEFEARVRGLWLWATGTTTLDELKTWIEDPDRTVEDIITVGKRIQRERVSRQAVSLYEMEMDDSPEDADPVFLSTLIQTRDMELFWDLRHAVKHGLVGHMEDLIPELLMFFTGGRNGNYAKQMYRILQVLKHESTDAIRHSIREHCWLVNMMGKKNTLYPIDQRQEINNKGIRVSSKLVS